MGNPNFIDELTEAERIAEEERIRALAGDPVEPHTGPMIVDGEPFAIPGPPDEATAQRGRDLRQSVARDILGRLEGNESQAFLDKLKLNANLTPENKATPANANSGFTVPPPTAARNMITMPPSGGGVPTFADVERAARGLDQQPDAAPPVVGNREGFENYTNPIEAGYAQLADRLHGTGEFAPGEDTFLHDFARNIPSAFPNTIEQALDTERFDAAGGFEGAEGAEEIGSVVGDKLLGAGAQMSRTVGGFAQDLSQPFITAGKFAKGFLGIGQDGPEAAMAEDAATAVDGVDLQNEQVGDGSGRKSDDAVVQNEQGDVGGEVISGPNGEPATTQTFKSDTPGAEGETATGSGLGQTPEVPEVPPTTFEQTPTGLRVNNPDLGGPPPTGMEIIRGLDRSYQPFDEQGNIPLGSGEIPFGDDRLEQLDNLGFTREQVPEVIRSEAQQQLAAGNAAKATTIKGPDGKLYQGFNIIQGDSTVDTVRTENLVPLGENTVQTTSTIEQTGVAGDKTKVTQTQTLEFFEDANGQTALRPVRIDNTVDPQVVKDANSIKWQAAQQAVAAQGLTGQAAEDAAYKLLLDDLNPAE